MPSIRFLPAFLILLILSSTALLTAGDPSRSSGEATSENMDTRGDDELLFNSIRLYKEQGVLYRGAFGDFLPDREGDEMATCSGSGKVRVFWGAGTSWENELVHTSYWDDDSDEVAQVFSIAAGSLIDGREGDEIVVCDDSYSTYMIWYESGSWISERLWRDDDSLYEVTIADVHDDPGNEVVIVGQTGRVVIVWGDSGNWNTEVIHTEDLALDACATGDISDEYEGLELVVGGTQKKVTLAGNSGTSWQAKDIAILDQQVTDLVIVDLDPRYEGKEIIASTQLGSVYIIHEEGGVWTKEIIHREGRSVYGLEAGLLVDGKMTLAIATWNNRLGLIWYDDSYQFKEVYREEWLMSGTGIHDLDPIHDGPEVFGFSEMGRVTMVYRDEPGTNMVLPFSSTDIRPGLDVSIPVLIQATGDFSGQTTVGTSEGSIKTSSITGSGFVELELSTIGQNDGDASTVHLSANNVEGDSGADFSYNVNGESPMIEITPGELNLDIGGDRQRSFELQINSSSPLSDPIEISPYLLPLGMTLTFNNTLCDPCGIPTGIRGTLGIATWAAVGTHHFFILATSGPSTRRAIPVTVRVQEASLEDIELLLGDDVIFLQEGEQAEIDVRAISINGFSQEVILDLTYPTSALEATLLEGSLIPTDNTTLRLTGSSVGGPFIVRVTASGSSLTREGLLKVFITPPPPDIRVTLPTMPLPVQEVDGFSTVTFQIGLEPMNVIVEDVRLTIREDGSGTKLSTDPSQIDRLPYPLNMTVVISAPEGQLEEQMVLYLEYGATGQKKIEITMEEKPEETEKESGPGLIIVSAVIIFLIALAVGIMIVQSRTNLFNREGKSSVHGEADSSPAAVQAGERDHGHPGSIDRRDPRR